MMLKRRWLAEVASRMQPSDILAQCGPWHWPCGRRALAFWSRSLQLDTGLRSGSPSGLPRGALLKALVSFFRVKIYRKKSVERASSQDGDCPASRPASRVSDVGGLPSSVPTGPLCLHRGRGGLLSTLEKCALPHPSPASKFAFPLEFLVALKSPSRLSALPGA